MASLTWSAAITASPRAVDSTSVRISEQVNPSGSILDTMMAQVAPRQPEWYFCRFCSKYTSSTLATVEHLCYARGVKNVLPPRGLELLRRHGYVNWSNASWIFYTQIRIPSRRAANAAVFSLQQQSTSHTIENPKMAFTTAASNASQPMTKPTMPHTWKKSVLGAEDTVPHTWKKRGFAVDATRQHIEKSVWLTTNNTTPTIKSNASSIRSDTVKPIRNKKIAGAGNAARRTKRSMLPSDTSTILFTERNTGSLSNSIDRRSAGFLSNGPDYITVAHVRRRLQVHTRASSYVSSTKDNGDDATTAKRASQRVGTPGMLITLSPSREGAAMISATLWLAAHSAIARSVISSPTNGQKGADYSNWRRWMD
jgi:hypothetical protein